MIAPPTVQGRLGLLGRSLTACALGGAGVALGWTLMTDGPMAVHWVLPVVSFASASVLGLEVFRSNSRRKLWVGSLCALIAVRSAYEVARLLLRR